MECRLQLSQTPATEMRGTLPAFPPKGARLFLLRTALVVTVSMAGCVSSFTQTAPGYAMNTSLPESAREGHRTRCVGDRIKSCAADLNRLAPGTTVAPDGTVQLGSSAHRIVNHLDGNGPGQSLVTRIVNAGSATTIEADPGFSGGQELHNQVIYNPGGMYIPSPGPGGSIQESAISGAAVLSHELIHADHENRGTIDQSTGVHVFRTDGRLYREDLSREELRTVGAQYNRAGDITERQILRQLGEPSRATYYNRPGWQPFILQPQH